MEALSKLAGKKGHQGSTYREKIMWRGSRREATCKPRREASEETKSASSLILKVQAPKLWENTFLCWKHPVCGVLWRQPEQTNMLTLGHTCDSLGPVGQDKYDTGRDWKSVSCCTRDPCQQHCEQVWVTLLDGKKHTASHLVTPGRKSTQRQPPTNAGGPSWAQREDQRTDLC